MKTPPMNERAYKFSMFIIMGLVAIVVLIILIESIDRHRTEKREAREEVAGIITACQSFNENRRVHRQFAAELARECPLCRTSLLEIDPDALRIVNCREIVQTLGEDDPGPTSNFANE